MNLFRPVLVALTLAAALACAGCGHLFSRSKAPKPAGPSVGGSVVYITNLQLPSDATVEIKLVEMNRDGGIVRVITEEKLPRPRKIPQPFDLPYGKGEINKSGYYGIDARILSEGKVLLAAPRPMPVLTRGNPKRAEVVLEPAK